MRSTSLTGFLPSLALLTTAGHGMVRAEVALERPPPSPDAVRAAQEGPAWQGLQGHSLRYLLSLPTAWSPERHWPAVVVITGSNSNFPVIAQGYRDKAGQLPFVIATPATVSSGSAITQEKYPHLDGDEISRLAATDMRGRLAYDLAGLDLVMTDLRERWAVEDRVYLSGFSMGGTLAWTMAFLRSDRLHAVFPVCACYDAAAAQGLGDGLTTIASPDLPILAFQGREDGMLAGFDGAWLAASDRARDLGMRGAMRMVTWRKHDWHYEEILLFCQGHYLGRQPRP